jgi:uncharacterized alpha-E superfamily protein
LAASFPEQFRDLHVQHLASFFRQLQDSLAYWAAPASEAPLIVLLTPGPYNETYFEHAYLARYLGFPLVEGHDLTVRGDCVYMRTLSGLRRVHAILRRLDDDYCDPLELRGNSALGVPGTLAGRACRQGAGRQCPRQRPARIRSATGISCQAPAKHLDELVIKGSYPSQRFDPVFGNELIGSPREEMIARLKTRPQAYVAQELVNFSEAPTWSTHHDRHLLPRGVGLRVFVAATPGGYVVMPGGLTRVSAASNARVISMQRGGSSKDTWVLTDQAVNTFSLLKHSVGKADLVRGGRNLSSRVVENLYWFGRYAERTDKTSRLLRVALSRLVDTGAEILPALTSAFDLCRALQLLPPVSEAETGSAAKVGTPPPELSLESQLLAAVCGTESSEGLAGDIRRLLWVATQVRERFSLDNWHAINRLQQQLQRYGKTVAEVGQPELSEVLAFLDQVLLVSSSLAGFAMDNMTRDDGWRFLIIGRRIERLVFLANAVAQFLLLDSTRAAGSLEWLLELTDSIITYRSRYMTQPQVLPTLDLIVFDEGNPHSVAFQLQILVRYLDNLTRLLGGPRDRSPAPGAGAPAGLRPRAFRGAELQRLSYLRSLPRTGSDPRRGFTRRGNAFGSPGDALFQSCRRRQPAHPHLVIAVNPNAARYHIVHETIYSYESPVSLSRQLLHLTPRDCTWQRCLAHQISVDPEVTAARERHDCFGNPVGNWRSNFRTTASTSAPRAPSRYLPHLPLDALLP